MRSAIAADTVEAFRARLAKPCGSPLADTAAPWVRNPPTAADLAKLASFRARLNEPRGVPLAYVRDNCGPVLQARAA